MCIFIHHLHHLNFGDLDYSVLIDKVLDSKLLLRDLTLMRQEKSSNSSTKNSFCAGPSFFIFIKH